MADQFEPVDGRSVIVRRSGAVEYAGDCSCDTGGESRCRRTIDLTSRWREAAAAAVVSRGSVEILYTGFHK